MAGSLAGAASSWRITEERDAGGSTWGWAQVNRSPLGKAVSPLDCKGDPPSRDGKPVREPVDPSDPGVVYGNALLLNGSKVRRG